MKLQLARLALLQITFVAYSILGIGMILWARYGSVAPADLFATHVRDYGILLLLFPVAWCIWAVLMSAKTTTDHLDGIALYMSGIALIVALAVIAFFATLSATIHHSLLIYVGSPPSIIGKRQLPIQP